MVLWIVCGYSALAAAFYLVLTATAADQSVPVLARPQKRQRAHKIKNVGLLRRIRTGIDAQALPLPKHAR